MDDYIINLDTVGMNDVNRVGGKNASLGEMISHLTQVGVNVPAGFATTAEAYWAFISEAGLTDRINSVLAVKKTYASLFNDRAIAYRVH